MGDDTCDNCGGQSVVAEAEYIDREGGWAWLCQHCLDILHPQKWFYLEGKS